SRRSVSVSMSLPEVSSRRCNRARAARMVRRARSASSSSQAAVRSSTIVCDSAAKEAKGRGFSFFGVWTRSTRCSVEAGEPVHPTRRSSEFGGVSRLAEQPAQPGPVIAETRPCSARWARRAARSGEEERVHPPKVLAGWAAPEGCGATGGGGGGGGGVADPPAEGAGGEVSARGVRGDRDGREQGELEAFGGSESEGVEPVEGGDRSHRHRSRGAEAELAAIGIVEFARDVE